MSSVAADVVGSFQALPVPPSSYMYINSSRLLRIIAPAKVQSITPSQKPRHALQFQKTPRPSVHIIQRKKNYPKKKQLHPL
jgi:hypothetical protein